MSLVTAPAVNPIAIRGKVGAFFSALVINQLLYITFFQFLDIQMILKDKIVLLHEVLDICMKPT